MYGDSTVKKPNRERSGKPRKRVARGLPPSGSIAFYNRIVHFPARICPQNAGFPAEKVGTAIAREWNSMRQIIGIAFLVAGIVLLCLAYNSYHSAASGVSRAFTGTSTDKTLWLVVGGIFGSLIGLGGLLSGSKKV
jgi:Protein of unknown function (DUF3185)